MRTCCSKIVCSAIGSGSHRRSAISRHLVSACTAAGIFECTHRATRTVLGSYRQLWASYHSNGISPDTSHVASTVLDGRVSTANPTEAKLPYLTKQLESEIPDCSDIFGVENSRFLDAKSNIFNDQPFLRPISSSNPTPTSRKRGAHPEILKLTNLLDQQNYQEALGLFYKIQEHHPKILATLSAFHFCQLIRLSYYRTAGFAWSRTETQRINRAASIYKTMQMLDVKLDFPTLTLAIDIFAKKGDINEAKAAYDLISVGGFDPLHSKALARICHAHILCGDEATGLAYFEQLVKGDNDPRSYGMLLKAFAKKGDQVGMVSVIDRIHREKIPFESTLVAIVWDFYQSRKDYAAVEAELAKFKANQGVLSLALYRILMRARNAQKSFTSVIELGDEMSRLDIEIDGTIHNEIIIAYAGMGDLPAMWRQYRLAADLPGVKNDAFYAMAKALGPHTSLASAKHLCDTLSGVNVPIVPTLDALLSGYMLMGDVETAKTLVMLNEHRSHGPTRAAILKVIWAHYYAGDANGAIAYAIYLKRAGFTIAPAVWIAILHIATKFKPDIVDKVKAYISKTYPGAIYDTSA